MMVGDELEFVAALREVPARVRRRRLRVARDEPTVAPALLRLPGIMTALWDACAAGCYLLECEAGADRRESTSEMAVERGWGVLELMAGFFRPLAT